MNLLHPDLLCDITLHVDAEMDRALYVSKGELTREQAGRILEHLLLATIDLAATWGVVLSPTAVAELLRRGGHRDE